MKAAPEGVRMFDDRVFLSELVQQIARTLIDNFPESWQKEGHDNDLRRDIAAALTIHGLEHAGLSGVLPHIRLMDNRYRARIKLALSK